MKGCTEGERIERRDDWREKYYCRTKGDGWIVSVTHNNRDEKQEKHNTKTQKQETAKDGDRKVYSK